MEITKITEKAYKIESMAVDNCENFYFTNHSENLYQVNKDHTKIILNIKGGDLRGIIWSNGTLYFCDRSNNQILSYEINTAKCSVLTGTGKQGHDDGDLKIAQFCFPRGITIDKNGNLYIIDMFNVKKIDLSSGLVSTVINSKGVNGAFGILMGIVVDNNGTIYVADQLNVCISKIENKTISTLGFIFYKPNLILREPSGPYELLLDNYGHLLVAEYTQLRKIDLNKKVVSKIEIPTSKSMKCLTKDNNGNIYVGAGSSIYLIEDKWKWKRFLWLGYLKEKDCPLSSLPKDIVKEILTHI